MTDKELLKLAAKAAGYSLHIWGTKGEENVVRVDEERHYRWNPLSDDGDALRLAVKLGVPIDFCHHSGIVTAKNPFNGSEFDSLPKDDRYAATRRAIVRAAAEIGRMM